MLLLRRVCSDRFLCFYIITSCSAPITISQRQNFIWSMLNTQKLDHFHVLFLWFSGSRCNSKVQFWIYSCSVGCYCYLTSGRKYCTLHKSTDLKITKSSTVKYIYCKNALGCIRYYLLCSILSTSYMDTTVNTSQCIQHSDAVWTIEVTDLCLFHKGDNDQSSKFAWASEVTLVSLAYNGVRDFCGCAKMRYWAD